MSNTTPKSEVHNCDCVEFMRTLPDKCFSLAIADPPYGGAGDEQMDGGGRFGQRFDRYKQQVPPPYRKESTSNTTAPIRKTECTSIAKIPPPTDSKTLRLRNAKTKKELREPAEPGHRNTQKKIVGWDEAPSEEFFKELFRVSEHQIIWGANYFPNMPATRCFIVWRKLTISESFSMAMAEYAWTSFNSNAKVFEMAPQGTAKDIRFHPTQKPVALYGWLLERYAKPGDTIFDPMMGSQSSRIAAWKKGYDYTGCELDKEYFDKGCARFDRECRGITVGDNGLRYQQTSLF